MIVKCPGCHTSYRYDVARFGDATSKKLKCPKCKHVFEIVKPDEDLDQTNIGPDGPQERSVASDPEKTDQVVVDPRFQESNMPQLAPLPKHLRFSLAVIAGNQAGSVFTMETPRVYLGRGSDVEIQLKDAETSRRHAMVEIRDEVATLVDLGSTNGTFVGGERIDQATLSNQSEFTLGSTTMMFLVTELGE